MYTGEFEVSVRSVRRDEIGAVGKVRLVGLLVVLAVTRYFPNENEGSVDVKLVFAVTPPLDDCMYRLVGGRLLLWRSSTETSIGALLVIKVRDFELLISPLIGPFNVSNVAFSANRYYK